MLTIFRYKKNIDLFANIFLAFYEIKSIIQKILVGQLKNVF